MSNIKYSLVNYYFGEVENGPWGLAFKIVTKRLVTRRKTPGLDDSERVKYIVRRLFPHVEPFQRQKRSSCVVRREELFTLEELTRAGGRLKANTAPGVDGVPKDILKDYPEILLEAFNSFLWGGGVLRRLEEAEFGPAEEEQQTSRRYLIL